MQTSHDTAIPSQPSTTQAELVAGLLAPQAEIPPKYFYDTLGSRLFEAICELPEYYPTRTEAVLFRRHAAEIAETAGTGTVLIDLGAGNCGKAAQLFSSLQPRQYVPVDIAGEFLQEAVAQLRMRFPALNIVGVAQDFSRNLQLPPAVDPGQRLFFYPGSSIGNFSPEEALAFLKLLRAAAGEDGAVLIGVDLVKDKAVLDAAYDDALGVTAAFNLNMLLHINRLIDADFDIKDWKHRAAYVPEYRRIEMHLEARRETLVTWQSGASRRFAEGERIHTENSYKTTPEDFVLLLAQAGFVAPRLWMDEQKRFLLVHARAG